MLSGESLTKLLGIRMVLDITVTKWGMKENGAEKAAGEGEDASSDEDEQKRKAHQTEAAGNEYGNADPAGRGAAGGQHQRDPDGKTVRMAGGLFL